MNGFSLVEMAIVLAVVGLMLGSGLTVLSAQIEQQRIKDTQRVLEDAKEALIGFAIANGRLPCPATAASNGAEVCAPPLPYNGFLPGVTLGMPGLDANGYVIDAWQRGAASRIRYAVTRANAGANAATTTDGIRIAPMSGFAPDLRVCSSFATATPPTCGPAANTLTSNAVAVIFSLGRNGLTAGLGQDEGANQDNDQVFITHEPRGQGAPLGGEFDDQLTWLPNAVLLNRMVQAGRLP